MRGLASRQHNRATHPRQRGPVSSTGRRECFIVDRSVRRLAGELARDYKSVHREVAMLTATGLIERRAADEVAVGWDRAVTELDLAA